MAAAKRKPDFEHSLRELETIVHQLEEGDLSLEASLKAFEQGVKLTRECQQALTDAEQRVQVLLEKDGAATTAPLDVEPTEDADDE